MSEHYTSVDDESHHKAATYNSRTLITSNILLEILRKEFGSATLLSSFKVVDFTKPGDNYVCLVTGIICEAIVNGEPHTLSYVAKLNPNYGLAGFSELCQILFSKEGGFLVDVAPQLNAILEGIGEPILSFPICVYSSYEEGKEMLISKDLRVKQFKMAEKFKEMDLDHASLVLKELARLHATGFILKSKLKAKSLCEEFPSFTDKFLEEGHPSAENIKILLVSGIETATEVLQGECGYEKTNEWLQDLRGNAYGIICDKIKEVTYKFETVCHGDTSNSNILFR